jgi:hypothetical protein
MLDFSHLPTSYTGDLQIFKTPSTVTNLQWDTWKKPRGVSMAYMLLLGGGGGGGGGLTGIAGANRGGGGSGASSGQLTIIIPLLLLPDNLYVQVGAGGTGVGSAGGTASSGLLSYVSVRPDNTANNVVAVSGAAGATGGASGTSGVGGAGGTGGTIAAIANMCFADLGVWTAVAGQAGVAGGNPGAFGVSQSFPTTGIFTMSGTGGAGVATVDQAGGFITAVANTLISDYRPVNPVAGSNDGSGGPTLWKPLFNYGGIGAAASNNGIGGQGGNGAFGSGGGGGGAGTTGGKGGDGGNGIVIIYCW